VGKLLGTVVTAIVCGSKTAPAAAGGRIILQGQALVPALRQGAREGCP
jgi:hypothetical protein